MLTCSPAHLLTAMLAMSGVKHAPTIVVAVPQEMLSQHTHTRISPAHLLTCAALSPAGLGWG